MLDYYFQTFSFAGIECMNIYPDNQKQQLTIGNWTTTQKKKEIWKMTGL